MQLATSVLATILILSACAGTEPSATGTSTAVPTEASPTGPSLPGGSASPGATTIAAQLSFDEDADVAAQGMATFEEGGTITATALDGTTFELAVPRFALAEDTAITLTPLSNVQGVGDRPAYAVRLEPEGLQFWDWPRLTITPATPIPVQNQLMFEANGDGGAVHAALIDASTEAIVLLLPHFSIAGAGYAEAHGAWQADRSLGRIQQLGHEAARVLAEIKRRVTIGEELEDDVIVGDRMKPFLDAAEMEARGAMREAAGISCAAAEVYVRTLIGIERQRGLVALSTPATIDATYAEILRVRDISFANCERLKIRECRAKANPGILMAFWLIWERERFFMGEMEGVTNDVRERATKLCLLKDYRIDKTISGVEPSATWSMHYTGIKCGGPAGEWVIDSNGSLSGGGDTADLGGSITVEISEGSPSGAVSGTYVLTDVDPGDTTTSTGRFSGSATFDEEGKKLTLDITTGRGGFPYGFLDTGITGPGTLTFQLEQGDFCLPGD